MWMPRDEIHWMVTLPSSDICQVKSTVLFIGNFLEATDNVYIYSQVDGGARKCLRSAKTIINNLAPVESNNKIITVLSTKSSILCHSPTLEVVFGKAEIQHYSLH